MTLIVDQTDIAGRFLDARRSAGSLSAYPGPFPTTLAQAYAIQSEAIARWKKPILGWKVGRIAAPLSDTLGSDRLAGPIFASERTVGNGSVPSMPVFAGGFAAGEAEFMLRIGKAPPAGKRRYALDEAADLIETVYAGIEIASSPLATINELGPIAVISDFGNNNGMLLGPEIKNWRSSGFEEWEVVSLLDGEEIARGRASSFPDGAIGAARFLFELMAERGIALEPGQWISSGAITGVHSAHPGQLVEARFSDEVALSCRLVAAGAE